MSTRLRLYAVASRNSVARALGLPVYTAGQKVVIKALYDVFAARGWDLDTSSSVIGDFEGEDSLLDPPTQGDHGEAGGVGQWHNVRRQIIKTNMGIDVWTCGPADAAKAFIGEVSEHWAAPYNKVELALIAAVGIPAKMQVLLSQFERSGNQPRDLARRVPMAQSVRALIISEGWGAAT